MQREDGKSVFGGPQRIINIAAVIAVADSLWFLVTSGPAMLEKFMNG